MNISPTRTVSGMRPTGPLHLGHYFGVLKNWVELQNTTSAFFFVADWHALTSDFADPSAINVNSIEMVKDWLASGLDPQKCTIFRQSCVKTHAELSLLFSMITPVSWLERCPTYKEQQQEISNKDLSNAGFLCYPVLMSADILIYLPKFVPVGQDQLPHLEMTREIARRFNHLYGDTFPEIEAHLTPAAKCPGIDGRKMSKSYNNGIFLRESAEDIQQKVMHKMLTDTARLRKSDPGNPDVCNLFPYHELLSTKDQIAEIKSGCVNASLGCVDCKKMLLQSLSEFLGPLQEKRSFYDKNEQVVHDILHEGNQKASMAAKVTMEVVRSKMGLA